jgi:hypothetical protein
MRLFQALYHWIAATVLSHKAASAWDPLEEARLEQEAEWHGQASTAHLWQTAGDSTRGVASGLRQHIGNPHPSANHLHF